MVCKITEDGRNVAKASYSRYYEAMYTGEFADVINPNTINTTGGVATYAWLGDLNGNGHRRDHELDRVPKSQFMPRANAIDPNLRDPKNDEIMFAFQRELASNVVVQRRLDPALVQRRDGRSELLGIPASVPTRLHAARVVTDPGPDNILNTGDDRQLTFYNVRPRTRGKDTFFHTNCGNNVSVDCTQRYKALELSLGKRMSNRWQLQGSYVWSRLDGDQRRSTTPTRTDHRLHVRRARAAAPTISRTPSSCSAATRRRGASTSARTIRR